MRVEEIAAWTGVSPHMVRDYNEFGLLSSGAPRAR